MGYNIDSAEIVNGTGSLRVSAKNARKLAKLQLPEGFREQIARLKFGDDGFAPLDVFWWYGEGSGWAYGDGRLEKAVALIDGSADVILTWEGGDSHSGLRIRDGKVGKCGVTLTLDPEEPAPDPVQAERDRCAGMVARLIIGWRDTIGDGLFYQALREHEAAMRDGTEAP